MFDSASSSSSYRGEVFTFDRRTSARYEYESREGDTAIHADSQVVPIRILNISVGGLALLSDRYIERSTLLSLELPSKDERGSRRLVMCVRAADSQPDGGWKIGCEFVRKLTNLELLALL
ncbi:MAG TPA: PilZ domain-containing protein [Gemmataceae bacterium]|nr:PilZ domain-containing protein [Gemmataceae bacterium]